MSAAAKLPASLARMKRMRDQGVPLDARTLDAIRAAEAEAPAVDDEGVGKSGEVHRVAEGEHPHDCGCAECANDRRAVGVDCGQYDPEAQYRQGVFVTKNAARYQSRRATSETPGESDDWELAPRTAPAARPRTKAKAAALERWKRNTSIVIDAIREWANDTFVTRADVATLERKLADLETKCADLENRSGATATASALADAYTGVHVDGKHYARGQLVTFGGSLWLAMRDNDGARPGKSDYWRLIVKHGRDSRSDR